MKCVEEGEGFGNKEGRNGHKIVRVRNKVRIGGSIAN